MEKQLTVHKHLTAIPNLSSGLPTFDSIAATLYEQTQKQHRRERLTVLAFRVGGIILILGLWQLVVTTGLVDKFLTSSPAAIAKYLYDTVPTTDFWVNVWSTLQAVIVGLVIGAVAGIAGGVLLYEYPSANRALDPVITFLNSLPRPALAPLFLVWFGFGLWGKTAVSISIVVFVLLLNTLAGLRSTDKGLLILARTLQMTRWQRLWRIQFLFALPSIGAGLKLGAVYSVLGVVVSEMLAADHGLGKVLVEQTNKFNIAGAFAMIVVMGLLSAVISMAVSKVERSMNWRD